MTTHTVVIPGIQNGPHTPLLMFSADAAELRGSEVTPIYWDPAREFQKDRSQASQWICEQIELALDGLDADEPPLLIAKSLGTLAALIAAERGCPAIWLTPLLVDEPFAEALRVAAAPCLLVGGTADWAWNGELAKQLSPTCWRSTAPTTACTCRCGRWPTPPPYWAASSPPSRSSWTA